MALTTADRVIRAGQLDWHMFDGINSPAELKALVDDEISDVDAFVYRRVGADTYASTDTRVQTLLGAAERYLTLSNLLTMLMARKVYGTHYPIDSEDSQSYDNPLANHYRQLAMEFLEEFAEIDTPGQGFALPVFLTSDALDLSTQQTQLQDLDDVLDEARGVPVLNVPQVGP